MGGRMRPSTRRPLGRMRASSRSRQPSKWKFELASSFFIFRTFLVQYHACDFFFFLCIFSFRGPASRLFLLFCARRVLRSKNRERAPGVPSGQLPDFDESDTTAF